VDGIRLVARILIVEEQDLTSFTIGGTGGSSRKKRSLQNTGGKNIKQVYFFLLEKVYKNIMFQSLKKRTCKTFKAL